MDFATESTARAAAARGQRNLDAQEDDRDEQAQRAAARAEQQRLREEDRAFWLRNGSPT